MDSWNVGRTFSLVVLVLSILVAATFSPASFSILLIPLSVVISLIREWNLLLHWREVRDRGEYMIDAKFKKERRNATIGLVILLLVIGAPALLTFLPAGEWISATLGAVMAWPASNIVIYGVSRVASKGRPLYKVYILNLIGGELLVRKFGYKLANQGESQLSTVS